MNERQESWAGGGGSVPCPLCGGQEPSAFERVWGRDYLYCPECDLVFLDPPQRLGTDVERAHYGHHQNDPGDARYRAFLDRLALPLQARLAPGAEGLDYGCGPGPTLSRMLSERGFPTADYDPFFAPDAALLERTYDFIACSETAEHFFDPAAEFARLARLLRPGGWLGIMTQLRRAEKPFAEWGYVRDPTHVTFYSAATLRWIARRQGWALEEPAPNVALFQRPAPQGDKL